MSGVFDPNTFLDQEETGSNSTYVEPVPAGEFTAIIKAIDAREVENKKRGGFSQILDITWELTDADLKATLDRAPTVRQSIFLDLDKTTGRLDMGKGKNVQLGRVREALGQNVPGQSWSTRNLLGAGPALVKVTQRPDEDDPDRIYNDVKGVTAIPC